MFGIGLPELIVILALALIVVGPDKLPDLARSVAKGILELKKTANTLKESLTENGNPLDEIKPQLEEAAQAIKDDVMGTTDATWKSSDLQETDAPVFPDEAPSADPGAQAEDATVTGADSEPPDAEADEPAPTKTSEQQN